VFTGVGRADGDVLWSSDRGALEAAGVLLSDERATRAEVVAVGDALALALLREVDGDGRADEEAEQDLRSVGPQRLLGLDPADGTIRWQIELEPTERFLAGESSGDGGQVVLVDLESSAVRVVVAAGDDVRALDGPVLDGVAIGALAPADREAPGEGGLAPMAPGRASGAGVAALPGGATLVAAGGHLLVLPLGVGSRSRRRRLGGGGAAGHRPGRASGWGEPVAGRPGSRAGAGHLRRPASHGLTRRHLATVVVTQPPSGSGSARSAVPSDRDRLAAELTEDPPPLAGVLARTLDLVAALRRAGLPAAQAGAIDAVRTLRHVELLEREQLREALAAVTVTARTQRGAFDELFDLYFPARPVAPSRPPGEASGAPEGEQAEADEDPDAVLRALLEVLGQGDEDAIRRAARAAVERFGRVEGRDGRVTYFQYKVFRAIDLQQLLTELLRRTHEEGDGALSPLEERLLRDEFERRLRAFRQEVDAEIRRHAAADRGLEQVADRLVRPPIEERDLFHLSREEQQELRAQIRPLARKLATRVAAKRRVGAMAGSTSAARCGGRSSPAGCPSSPPSARGARTSRSCSCCATCPARWRPSPASPSTWSTRSRSSSPRCGPSRSSTRWTR
jgi:hypothetical protein